MIKAQAGVVWVRRRIVTLCLGGAGVGLGCVPLSGGGGPTADCTAVERANENLTTGSVAVSSTACPDGGQVGADCYQAIVTCAGVSDAEALVKYHPGLAETVGTVILTTGGGGSSLYDDDLTFGLNLVDDLNEAGFATVQIAWIDEWIEGPGGVEQLSCRYATLAQWIYEAIHLGGAGAPFCATGNSGGSSQIAYAMTRYHFDALFDAIVPSSGPPVGRIDLGCACTPGLSVAEVPCGVATLCYSEARRQTVDTSYSGTPCEDECLDVLAADSVVAEGVDLDYPTTKVIAVFGDLDSSNAIAQGMQWYNAITSDVEIVCVPEAGHGVASTQEGYEALRDELIAECRLQS